MTRGTDLIAAERDRHVSEEGYDTEHDRGHAGQLAAAGASYAFGQGYALQFPTDGGRQYIDKVPAGMWPWAWNYWKPSRSAVRTLVKAGALIAAAIDSLLDDQDARSTGPCPVCNWTGPSPQYDIDGNAVHHPTHEPSEPGDER